MIKMQIGQIQRCRPPHDRPVLQIRWTFSSNWSTSATVDSQLHSRVPKLSRCPNNKILTCKFCSSLLPHAWLDSSTWSAFRSSDCADGSEIRITSDQTLPTRPVLPMRWTYSSIDAHDATVDRQCKNFIHESRSYPNSPRIDQIKRCTHHLFFQCGLFFKCGGRTRQLMKMNNLENCRSSATMCQSAVARIFSNILFMFQLSRRWTGNGHFSPSHKNSILAGNWQGTIISKTKNDILAVNRQFQLVSKSKSDGRILHRRTYVMILLPGWNRRKTYRQNLFTDPLARKCLPG
jgi:hypothetical protein